MLPKGLSAGATSGFAPCSCRTFACRIVSPFGVRRGVDTVGAGWRRTGRGRCCGSTRRLRAGCRAWSARIALAERQSYAYDALGGEVRETPLSRRRRRCRTGSPAGCAGRRGAAFDEIASVLAAGPRRQPERAGLRRPAGAHRDRRLLGGGRRRTVVLVTREFVATAPVDGDRRRAGRHDAGRHRRCHPTGRPWRCGRRPARPKGAAPRCARTRCAPTASSPARRSGGDCSSPATEYEHPFHTRWGTVAWSASWTRPRPGAASTKSHVPVPRRRRHRRPGEGLRHQRHPDRRRLRAYATAASGSRPATTRHGERDDHDDHGCTRACWLMAVADGGRCCRRGADRRCRRRRRRASAADAAGGRPSSPSGARPT